MKERLDLYQDLLPPGALARCGTTRMRHGGSITAIAFSPDGKQIAVADQTGTLVLWNVNTGEELVRSECENGAISALVFTDVVAIGTTDGMVQLLDLVNGRKTSTFDAEKFGVQSIDISRDERLVVTGHLNGKIGTWDKKTLKQLSVIDAHSGPVNALGFSFDGTTMVSAAEELKLWAVSTANQLKNVGADSSPYYSLAISQDGTTAAVGGFGVAIWDISLNKQLATIAQGQRTTTLAFTQQGKLVSGSGESVQVWDPRTGDELCRYDSSLEVNSVAASNKSGLIAFGGWECVVRMRQSDGPDRTIVPTKYPFGNGVFLQGTQELVAIGPAGEVQFWDGETGKLKRSFPTHEVPPDELAVSTDGKLIATVEDQETVIWRAEDFARVSTIRGDNPKFSPDARTIATCLGSDVIIYDSQSGRQLRSLSGHNDKVSCVAYSPNGSMLASGSYDETIRVLRPNDGAEIRKLTGHSEKTTEISFSGSGKFFASVGRDGHATVWNSKTLRKLQSFRHNDWVSTCVFSFDERKLITGSGATLHVWDIHSGQVEVLNGHRGEIDCLSLSSDGRFLASSSFDKTILIWDTALILV